MATKKETTTKKINITFSNNEVKKALIDYIYKIDGLNIKDYENISIINDENYVDLIIEVEDGE